MQVFRQKHSDCMPKVQSVFAKITIFSPPKFHPKKHTMSLQNSISLKNQRLAFPDSPLSTPFSFYFLISIKSRIRSKLTSTTSDRTSLFFFFSLSSSYLRRIADALLSLFPDRLLIFDPFSGPFSRSRKRERKGLKTLENKREKNKDSLENTRESFLKKERKSP